jgi:hypothetical protein
MAQMGHFTPERVMYPAGRPFLLVRERHQGDTMTTEAALAPDDGTAVHPEVCSCGQDLDCCEREHCPRCGCLVHRAA